MLPKTLAIFDFDFSLRPFVRMHFEDNFQVMFGVGKVKNLQSLKMYFRENLKILKRSYQ